LAENELQFRCIGDDPGSKCLDSKDEKDESGTASLAMRTRKASKKMSVGVKLTDGEMIVKTSETE
jgi:hypothetical protein